MDPRRPRHWPLAPEPHPRPPPRHPPLAPGAQRKRLRPGSSQPTARSSRPRRNRSQLLVAGFSDRSNSAVRRRNGGFPCRIWAPTVRRDKITRWNCLKRNFVSVRVGCSQSAMSVLTRNVFRPVQAITEKVGHFSASRPNSSGQRNPQPVGTQMPRFQGLAGEDEPTGKPQPVAPMFLIGWHH